MARYYGYRPQQYNSQFVPLPIDLLAAQAQQKQGQIDTLNASTMAMEDEFRKSLALDIDKPRRKEILDTYKTNVSKLYDESKGDVNMMFTGLKNINNQFQEDMARGEIGAIQQSYNTYQEVDKLWQEAKKSGNQDDITYYYNLKKKLKDWEDAGGTQLSNQPGVYTTFGADTPGQMFNRDKYQERIESNWKDDIETSIKGDVNYKHLESAGGLEFSEVYGAMRGDLLSRKDFNDYAEAKFYYGIRDLNDTQIVDGYTQIAQNEYSRAMQIADYLKKQGQEGSTEYNNAMRRAELAKRTYETMNSDADMQDKKLVASTLEKDIFADETIQMSVDKIVHKENKMSDLIMSVEGMTAAGVGVEKYKATQKEPVMAIPAGPGDDAGTILDALQNDKSGVSTASYNLLTLANNMGIDVTSFVKNGRDGVLPFIIDWKKAKEVYNGFQVAEDPLAYVNSMIPKEENKLKEGTPEAAVALSTMQAAAESFDEAESQSKIDQQLASDLTSAYANDIVGLKIDATGAVYDAGDIAGINKKYPGALTITQGASQYTNKSTLVITPAMYEAYSKNGTTGYAFLDKEIKKQVVQSVSNNPAKATGFMMEYTGGTYDDLSKSYSNSINPQNISNFVDMAGEPINPDFLKAFTKAYDNKKVTYTTIKPNGGGAAFVKVTAYDEDGTPTSKILRTDVGNVRANIREKMAEQIIHDYNNLDYDAVAADELARTNSAAYGEFITLTPILEFDNYKQGKPNYIKTEAGILILTKQPNGTVTLQHKDVDGETNYVTNNTTRLPQLFADPDAVKEYIGIYGIKTFRTEESKEFTDEVLTKRLK